MCIRDRAYIVHVSKACHFYYMKKLQAIHLVLYKRWCKTAKIKRYKHEHYALAQTLDLSDKWKIVAMVLFLSWIWFYDVSLYVFYLFVSFFSFFFYLPCMYVCVFVSVFVCVTLCYLCLLWAVFVFVCILPVKVVPEVTFTVSGGTSLTHCILK